MSDRAALEQYIEVSGAKYVLVDYALKHQEGAAQDAMKLMAAFVMGFRPEDEELHKVMEEIMRPET